MDFAAAIQAMESAPQDILGPRQRPEPLAITGTGLVTCLGRGVRANWEALCSGRSGLGPISSFDVGGYPVKDAGEPPPLEPEALAAFPREISPLAWLVEACREALGQAGPGPKGPERTALIVGSSLASSLPSESFFRTLIDQGPDGADYRSLEGYYIEDHLARLALSLGIQGPSFLVSNACAAGASCIARAAECIRAGRVDRAVACGYDALSPFTHAGFGSLFALTKSRLRPFGRGRDGMLIGCGFAALVLERSDGARRAGHAVRGLLAGYGESADAHHLTHPHPEGFGAALAMRRALGMAGIGPGDINYINCHATATPSNDAAEAKALQAVFGGHLPGIPLNASKPNVGHTLGAAGTVEAVVTLQVLGSQFVPPTLNMEDPEPDLRGLDFVPRGRPARVRYAMSNSFGFGGCNASLVFEAAGASPGGERIHG